MKIVNINRKNINYWNNWHKEISKLHANVKGIYDYIYYTNPPFTIYNSPNRPEEAVIDMNNSINPLIYAFTIEGINYNFFLASALRYHQGFENLTNNDNGILCYKTEEGTWRIIGEDDEDNETGLYAEGFLLEPLIVQRDREQDVLYAITEEKIINSEDIDNIKCDEGKIIDSKQLLDNGQVKIIFNDEVSVGETVHPYLDKQTFLYDKPIHQTSISLPAGYVCLSNIQPTGEKDNTVSLAKRHLSNYLIYPLGNSGYYQWNYANSMLSANYYKNEIGKLSSKSVVNLSITPLRYINYNYPASNQWSNNTYTLVAYGNDMENIVIGDIDGNVWDGNFLIQPYTVLADDNVPYQEEVFTDTTFVFNQTTIVEQQIKPLFEARNIKNTNLSNIRIKFL